MSKSRRRLVLIGKGDGWRNAPRYGDFESWGVNDLVLQRPVDMVFDMHPLDQRWRPDVEHGLSAMELAECQHDPKKQEWTNMQIGLVRTVNHCADHNIPLMTLNHYDFAPTSIRYPLEDVVRELRSDNFTNGIDYMIAFAIYSGVFTDIELYGINMAMGSEYEWEKPGCDFWLGYAKGRGIRVNVNSHITLLMKPRDGKLYGFGTRQTFKEDSCMGTRTVEFNILDRIVLINTIPKQKGSFEQLKSIEHLKTELSFTPEEQAELKFQQQGDSLHWDDTAGKKIKSIELDDYALSTIVESLKWASDHGRLAEDHLSLYEKFVTQFDGRIEGQVTISEQVMKDHQKTMGRRIPE